MVLPQQFSFLTFAFLSQKKWIFSRLPTPGRRIRMERINEAGSICVLSHRWYEGADLIRFSGATCVTRKGGPRRTKKRFLYRSIFDDEGADRGGREGAGRAGEEKTGKIAWTKIAWHKDVSFATPLSARYRHLSPSLASADPLFSPTLRALRCGGSRRGGSDTRGREGERRILWRMELRAGPDLGWGERAVKSTDPSAWCVAIAEKCILP